MPNPSSNSTTTPSVASISYAVRESARAKHVSLRISAEGELEVVVPRGFDRSHIPAILAQKQRWIERAQRRMDLRRSQADPVLANPFPDSIDLAALDQIWQVSYRPSAAKGLRYLVHPNCQLVLLGDSDDWNLCRAALKQWLVQTAKQQLSPWLARISDQTGLTYQRVTVRSPKTRWGSCSSTHSISLNSKLLFLRPAVVRYVLVHELCHTVHFNHSPKFWDLVSRHESRYEALKTELRQGHHQVPHWME